MRRLRRFAGGVLATLGFVLSPLSWWNDLFVNLPLAYAIGVLAGLLHATWFLPGMIAGYWLSNVLGLLLMHLGIRYGWRRGKVFSRRELAWDVAISIAYTVAIVALVQAGWLAFPEDELRALLG